MCHHHEEAPSTELNVARSLQATSSRRGVLVGSVAAAFAATGFSRRATAKSLPVIGQPGNPVPQSFMARAEAMKANALKNGDQGFGAVIVRGKLIVGQAPSRVVSNTDPTAHAEVEAIRDACRRLGTRNLSGCVMYGTFRACPMCETAAYWARIDRLVYGPNLTDSGRPRYGGK